MTIFCHGTKQFSDEVAEAGRQGIEDAELVTILESSYKLPLELASQSFNGGKLLLQGVGSEHNPRRMALQVNNGWASVDNRSASSGFASFKQKMGNVFNQASGSGTSFNVGLAVDILDGMAKDGRRPTVVNIVGWSRGGVACVRLAEKLSKNPRLRDIEVNIFAGDPVPGGPRASTRAIPNQVRRYLQIYALDVVGMKSGVFRGLQPQASGNTVCVVLPMPGDHSQVVKANMSPTTSAGVALAAKPGSITKDLAIRFLKACGSEGVTGQSSLRPAEALAMYEVFRASIEVRSGAFPGSEKAAAGGFRQTGHRPHWSSVRGSNVPRPANIGAMGGSYINEHHRFLESLCMGRAPTSGTAATDLFKSLYG